MRRGAGVLCGAAGGVAGYAERASNDGGTMYMPVRAAYANPTYFAAYGRSPVMYRPVSTAGYAPAAGGYYAPCCTAKANAPTTVNYAPANSYAVTPAGMSSAGSEAAAYYGQPTTLNYVPPRYCVSADVLGGARVCVSAGDDVSAGDRTAGDVHAAGDVQHLPAAADAVLFVVESVHLVWAWSLVRTSACGPAPTTTYCGTAACGQPYYPVQPWSPWCL